MSLPNGLSVVEDVRKMFGATLNDEACGLLTNEVAWRLAQTDANWGVSAKPQGKSAVLPNGTKIAHDILHYRATNVLIDILQAAGAESRPQWVEVPYHGDTSGRPWLPAVNPASFGSTPSTPAPPPAPAPPSETQEILSAMNALNVRVSWLTAEVASLRTEMRDGAAASVRVEQRLRAGIPLRIKSFIGKIVGTVGGE